MAKRLIQGPGQPVYLVDGDGTMIQASIVGGPGNFSAPGVNTAATITYGAVGGTHVIGGVAWSYNAAPTAGNLQITIGGLTVFSIDITATGPGSVLFNPALSSGPSTAMVITPAAAGAAVSGKVNALGYRME
jgi:hypothetical protein